MLMLSVKPKDKKKCKCCPRNHQESPTSSKSSEYLQKMDEFIGKLKPSCKWEDEVGSLNNASKTPVNKKIENESGNIEMDSVEI